MKTISSLYIFLIVVVVILANLDLLPWWVDEYRHVPYGDKISHFLLIGSLALTINILLNFKVFSLYIASIYLGSLITFLLITCEEYSQKFITERTFSYLDLLANYMGILFIGEFMGHYLKNRFDEKYKKSNIAKIEN